MKKIILGTILASIIILVLILYFSYGRGAYEQVVYTIPREYTYWYQKDKKMSFELFLNQEEGLISFPNDNQYRLSMKDKNLVLNHIEVSIEENCQYQNQMFYRYLIHSDCIPVTDQIVHLNDVYLTISNVQFDLSCYLGNITIYPPDLQTLPIQDLYGNYAYIDQELMLIGITIGLSEKKNYLNEMRIGSAFGVLNWIENDTLLDSEIDNSMLKHSVEASYELSPPYPLNASNNYYFIPISYPKKMLITNACIYFKIDGESYMIDNFDYCLSTIYLNLYPNSLFKGEIGYA